MKALTLATLVIGLSLTPVSSESQSRSTLSPDDIKQINALSQEFAKGLLAKQWKTVTALYADNAILYPPGEAAVKGRASIEACLTAFPSATDFTMRTTSVEGRDDVAYAQGTYAMTIAAEANAKPIQASGYFLAISRKQPDGRWLIAVHMLTAHE